MKEQRRQEHVILLPKARAAKNHVLSFRVSVLQSLFVKGAINFPKSERTCRERLVSCTHQSSG